MAELLAIWGPHRRWRMEGRLKWSFTAVRENGEFVRYNLVFYADTRRFSTKVIPSRDNKDTDQMMIELPELKRGILFTGPVTPHLKERLSKEDIAKATGLSLRAGMAR